MRPGTPGFKGERLVEARLAQGLSGAALADLLGVSRQLISQYEKNGVTPGPQVLEQMARELKVSTQFFLRAPNRAEIGTVFYRSLKSTSKAVRGRAVTKLGWLKELTRYVEGYVELPEVDIPDAEADPLSLSNKDIERIAREVREHFGLGYAPVDDMVLALENHGAVVSRLLAGSEKVDAFSEWCSEEGRPYVLLSEDKQSAVRSRLDAGHELGHMVLHRRVPQAVVNSRDLFNLIEAQAFRFAGAFLLPKEEFAADFFLPELNELYRLKKHWKVAMSAIIKRCQDLGLLPDSELKRLYIAMGRRGWRTSEPLDDELVPEQPKLLAESTRVILEETPTTRRDICTSLPHPREDLERLAGLPLGFLEERESGPPRVTVREERRGNVVDFPKKP